MSMLARRFFGFLPFFFFLVAEDTESPLSDPSSVVVVPERVVLPDPRSTGWSCPD